SSISVASSSFPKTGGSLEILYANQGRARRRVLKSSRCTRTQPSGLGLSENFFLAPNGRKLAPTPSIRGCHGWNRTKTLRNDGSGAFWRRKSTFAAARLPWGTTETGLSGLGLQRPGRPIPQVRHRPALPLE